jgi:hypothetical protein
VQFQFQQWLTKLSTHLPNLTKSIPSFSDNMSLVLASTEHHRLLPRMFGVITSMMVDSLESDIGRHAIAIESEVTAGMERVEQTMWQLVDQLDLDFTRLSSIPKRVVPPPSNESAVKRARKQSEEPSSPPKHDVLMEAVQRELAESQQFNQMLRNALSTQRRHP